MAAARLSGTPAPVELTAKLAETEKRLGTLDQQGFSPDRRDEKKSAIAQELAVAVMVEREMALSRQEKIEFAGFLKSEFFTKRDFDALAVFYQNSWDKLSEEGKDEMTQRVWEGARQGEYELSELPENVRSRTLERLHLSLKGEAKMPPSAPKLGEKEQQEFIFLLERGNLDQALDVLDGQSLPKETVSLGRLDSLANSEERGSETVPETQRKVEQMASLDWSNAKKPSELEPAPDKQIIR